MIPITLPEFAAAPAAAAHARAKHEPTRIGGNISLREEHNLRAICRRFSEPTTGALNALFAAESGRLRLHDSDAHFTTRLKQWHQSYPPMLPASCKKLKVKWAMMAALAL